MRAGFDRSQRTLILQGDTLDYEWLSDGLAARAPDLRFDDSEIDERTARIRVLEIRLVEGPLVIGTRADRVSITGSAEALDALVSDIRLFVRYNELDEPGVHSHIEPNWTPSGQHYLDPCSASLLLTGHVAELPE